MAKRKTTSKGKSNAKKSAAKKKVTKRAATSSSAKKKKAVRDVKAKKKPKRASTRKKKDSFTIHRMDTSDAPKIEPLDDDRYGSEPDGFKESFPGSEDLDVDIEYEPVRMPKMSVAPVKEEEMELTDEVEELADSVKKIAKSAPAAEAPPKDVIRVKFASFVQLVSQYDLESVMEANKNEDVIINANLLTDLASSREKREEKRVPLVFLVGIAIGVVLTYIFFST